MGDILLTGVVMGVLATVFMDLWGIALNRFAGQPLSNWAKPGRWLMHALQGRVFHDDIAEGRPRGGRAADRLGVPLWRGGDLWRGAGGDHGACMAGRTDVPARLDLLHPDGRLWLVPAATRHGAGLGREQDPEPLESAGHEPFWRIRSLRWGCGSVR